MTDHTLNRPELDDELLDGLPPASFGDELAADLEGQLGDAGEPAPRFLDPVSLLTLDELDKASRELHHDVMQACQSGHYLRPAALALVAWLHAKREDPKVRLSTFRAMTLDELVDGHLTFPDPAGELAALVDERDELGAGAAVPPPSPAPATG